jgi:hypothetical protein
MYRLIVLALVGSLVGCSNMSPAGNAVLGAAVGVAIAEQVRVQHHPVYIPPHPRARHCMQVPIRDYYGNVVGFRTNCY